MAATLIIKKMATKMVTKIAFLRDALSEAVPETPLFDIVNKGDIELQQVMRKYLLIDDREFMPSVLCIAASELVGEEDNLIAMPAACAIAMVETIRVINRELSSMKKDVVDATDILANCGEAVVVLAGGALIARAFTYLTTDVQVDGKRILRAVGELARAAGFLAASKGEEIAVLCECSAVVGAIVGGGSEDQIERIRMYGRCLGHAADSMKNAKDELVKPRSDGECFDGEKAALMLALTDYITS